MRIRNLDFDRTFETSSKISFVLGVYSGYNHNNKTKDGTKISVKSVAQTIMEFIEKNAETIGEINFTIEPVKCLYRTKYGCPKEGEDAYRLSTVFNPAYGHDEEEWFDTTIVYAYYLAKIFNQSTITIEYIDGGCYDDDEFPDIEAGFYTLYIELDEVRVIQEKEKADDLKSAIKTYLNKMAEK